MRKIKQTVTILLFIILSCKSSSPAYTDAEITALNLLISNGEFRIESDWAYPQVTAALQQVMSSGLMPPGSSSNAVSLIGNSNFMEIKKDIISSYLPYFGERQMQVDYGSNDSAIQFDGAMENYKVVKGKNDSYDISFNAMSKSEKFNVNIKIFPNLRADIGLSGGSRFGIRYSGKVTSP